MIQVRGAVKKDIADICRLADVASCYMFEFLFSNTLDGLDYFQVMQYSLLNSDSKFCYKNCLVAEDGNGKVMGVMCCFPPSEYKRSANEKSIIPSDRIKHLAPLYEITVPDAYVLYILSVYPAFQKQGVASRLLEIVKNKAIAQGFKKCCLDVWEDNKEAIQFYLNKGFKIVAQGKIAPHKLIRHSGVFYVMQCDFDLPS